MQCFFAVGGHLSPWGNQPTCSSAKRLLLPVCSDFQALVWIPWTCRLTCPAAFSVVRQQLWLSGQQQLRQPSRGLVPEGQPFLNSPDLWMYFTWNKHSLQNQYADPPARVSMA